MATSGPLGPPFPGRNSHRPQLPLRARRGGARGQGSLRSPGRARLPGRGRAQVFPFLPGLGRESPTWPYTGTERRWPLPPAWADGAGLAPSLLPSRTQSRDRFAAGPGIWGSRRGLGPPGHGGTQGGAGDPLEPGERDRDKSLLSPSLLAELPALSWSVSLGKRNCLPRIPPCLRLQVKTAGKLRHGLGQDGAGKGNPTLVISPKWGIPFPSG